MSKPSSPAFLSWEFPYFFLFSYLISHPSCTFTYFVCSSIPLSFFYLFSSYLPFSHFQPPYVCPVLLWGGTNLQLTSEPRRHCRPRVRADKKSRCRSSQWEKSGRLRVLSPVSRFDRVLAPSEGHSWITRARTLPRSQPGACGWRKEACSLCVDRLIWSRSPSIIIVMARMLFLLFSTRCFWLIFCRVGRRAHTTPEFICQNRIKGAAREMRPGVDLNVKKFSFTQFIAFV